jgi:serine/threonine protein kinase
MAMGENLTIVCHSGTGRASSVQLHHHPRAYSSPEGYRIEAMLGRGRQSAVYLAWHSRFSRSVALKVAGRTQLESLHPRRDFSQEYSLAAGIIHPSVLQILDHGADDNQAWLAMEYVPGGRLARNIAPLAPSQIVSRLRQVATALAQVHAQRLVHRDVKPANLLVRGDGSLVLGDFGCVCRQDEVESSRRGTIVGTPQYAAPEQSLGGPAAPAADVYSLGVLLYEWLHGRTLFCGETVTELFCQHQLAPIPRLGVQQAAWQPLLDAMLAKDPGQRHPDGQAVLAALEQHEPVLLLSPGHHGQATAQT